MIESRLYEALLSEARCAAGQYRCYGFRLAPFSLRHSLQLSALESPVATGAEWTDLDLIVAARICASREPVADPFHVLPGKMRIAWLRARHDRAQEERRFAAYFAACYARPQLFERPTEGGGASLHAPFELIVASYLARKTTLLDERIWTMPAGLALWYFESVKEQESGDSDILTEKIQAEIAAQNSAAERARGERLTAYFVHLQTLLQQPETAEDAAELMAAFSESGEPPDAWNEDSLAQPSAEALRDSAGAEAGGATDTLNSPPQ